MISEVKKFFDEMKQNPKRALLYALVVVVIFIVASFVNSFISDAVSTKNSSDIEAEKSNIAVGNNAPVSQTLNVNEEAAYTWVNEKNWENDGWIMGGGKYLAKLIFIASGPVIPVTPCLYVSSDTKLEGIGPIGSSVTWGYTTSDTGAYIECFSGLSNNVTFQGTFASKPAVLKTQLVQDNRGLDAKVFQPHNMLPLVQ